MLKNSKFFRISGLQTSAALVNPVTVTEFIATRVFFLSKSIDFSLKQKACSMPCHTDHRELSKKPKRKLLLQVPPKERLSFEKHYS